MAELEALYPAERALREKARLGERLELDPEDPPQARTVRGAFLRELFVPAPGDEAADDARAFAVFVRHALVEGGLDLSNLRGPNGQALRALFLHDCVIPGRMNLTNAHLRQLSLVGSAIHQLDGQDAHFEGRLDLRGVRSAGGVLGFADEPLCHVQLANAYVFGDVTAEGARLCVRAEAITQGTAGPTPYALDLRGAHVAGAVWLEADFDALGGVTFADARISGDIWMRGARLRAGHGAFAFRGQKAHIDGVIVGHVWDESRPLEAIGSISLRGAQIGGRVDLRGARIANGRRWGGQLIGSGARIGGSLQLGVWSDRFRSRFESGVWLDNVEINGDLDAPGALLGDDARHREDGSAPVSLSLVGATIRKSLHLGCWSVGGALHRFEASGRTHLEVAEITNNLGMAGSIFRGIDASNLRIGGDLKGGPLHHEGGVTSEDLHYSEVLSAEPRLEVVGDLVLVGATVGKRLCLSGARLERLRAHDLEVLGRLDLKGAEVNEMDLRRARSRGMFDLSGATLVRLPTPEGGYRPPRLRLMYMIVEGVLYAHDVEVGTRVPGRDAPVIETYAPRPLRLAPRLGRGRRAHGTEPPVVDLTGAQADMLDDQTGLGWGDVWLVLEGFRYKTTRRKGRETAADRRLSPDRPVEARLDWLRRQFRGEPHTQETYRPQPYAQLAEVYRLEGRDDEARAVIIEKLRLENQLGLRRLKTPWGWLVWPVLALPDFLFRHLFGYGLRPIRSLGACAVFLLAGIVGAYAAQARGLLVVDAQPVVSAVSYAGSGRAELGYREAEQPTVRYVSCGSEVEPALYAIDVFIPVVDLRQKARCEIRPADEQERRLLAERASTVRRGLAALWPAGGAGRPAAGAPKLTEVLRAAADLVLRNPRTWLLVKAAYACLGWIVVSLTLLTISGVLRRNAEK